MSAPLFNNLDYLEEKPSNSDALGYENEITHVKTRIERLIEKNKHSIVAYLGPFGVGKSTVLSEVRKQTSDYKWITFEMWRYANRNELWDGFVIKLAAETTPFKNELDVAGDIEGKRLNWKEYVGVVVWLIVVLVLSFAISGGLWLFLHASDTTGGQFAEAYLKYASPAVVTILLLVGLDQLLKLRFISEKRPLRRVFELENLLYKRVKNMRKPLVVVVEDVDRSSEDGAIFLETLNHFLGSLTSEAASFIVIAPQSTQAFSKSDENSYRGLETALKIYDEKIYFNSSMNDDSIVKFYEELGVDPRWEGQLIQATQAIIGAHGRSITVRLLKHTLREANQFMEMNPDINPVIALTIILSRYVAVERSGNMELAIRVLDSHRPYNSSGAKAFFIAIALGIGEYDEANKAKEYILNFTAKGDPETEIIEHGNGSRRYVINIAGIYGFLIV